MNDQKEISVITTNPHPFNFWAVNAVGVDGNRIDRKGDFTDFNTFVLLLDEASKAIAALPNVHDMDHYLEFMLFDGEEYICHLNFDKLNKRVMPKRIHNVQLCGVESYRAKYMALFGKMAFIPYIQR